MVAYIYCVLSVIWKELEALKPTADVILTTKQVKHGF